MRDKARHRVPKLPRGGLMYECTGCGAEMPDDAQHILYCDECLLLDTSDEETSDPWEGADE